MTGEDRKPQRTCMTGSEYAICELRTHFPNKISIRVNVIETKIKNSFVVRMNCDRVVNEMWHIYTARTRQSNNHTYSVDQEAIRCKMSFNSLKVGQRL